MVCSNTGNTFSSCSGDNEAAKYFCQRATVTCDCYSTDRGLIFVNVLHNIIYKVISFTKVVFHF